MVYFWIILGSGLGGVARLLLGTWVAKHAGAGFPWGTLLVNVAGCAFIGWFAFYTGELGPRPAPLLLRQFVMIGICGGFTTFSSFSLETLNLMKSGHTARAFAYIAASVVLCMLGVWFGSLVALRRN